MCEYKEQDSVMSQSGCNCASLSKCQPSSPVIRKRKSKRELFSSVYGTRAETAKKGKRTRVVRRVINPSLSFPFPILLSLELNSTSVLGTVARRATV